MVFFLVDGVSGIILRPRALVEGAAMMYESLLSDERERGRLFVLSRVPFAFPRDQHAVGCRVQAALRIRASGLLLLYYFCLALFAATHSLPFPMGSCHGMDEPILIIIHHIHRIHHHTRPIPIPI